MGLGVVPPAEERHHAPRLLLEEGAQDAQHLVRVRVWVRIGVGVGVRVRVSPNPKPNPKHLLRPNPRPNPKHLLRLALGVLEREPRAPHELVQG